MRRLLIGGALVTLGCAGVACWKGQSKPPRARNAILVVVDTLRADHLGLYGYERETSPHLDRWAERARVFDRAYATSSWTLPTIGSLLTGTLPATHAAGARLETRRWKRSKLDDGVETLAETLSSAGWKTGALVSNPWLRPRFGLARGFDDYSYERDRVAEASVDEALSWIASAEEPFFLFVHLIDPHLPYKAPEPFYGHFAGEPRGFEPRLNELRKGAATISDLERQATIDRYDEEVAYVDRELGRFLDALDARRFLSKGLIILTSDHGEEFFEHGGFEHGHAMYDEVVRVPLLAIGPGASPGTDVRTASSVDVAPTILDALGVEPSVAMLGTALLCKDEGGTSALLDGTYYGTPQEAIIDWPLKLVLGRRGATLYDLETDPGEAIDLAPERGESVDRLRALLDERRSDVPRGRARHPGGADEETARELKSLGYLN